MDPYEIHDTMVRNSESETLLSRKIDSYLNQKFKREMAAYFNPGVDEFMQVWESRFNKSETEGLLWVAATRADLPFKNKRSIFGDIHMEMLINAIENRKVRYQLFLFRTKIGS